MATQTPPAILNELAALRRENTLQAARLARAGEDRRAAAVGAMIDRAMLDAALLITIHVGGGCIDRDVAPLPQRRWNRATSLLRFAGLARGRRVELQLKPTPEATLKALQDATEAARRNPAQWAAHMSAYNRAAALQRPIAKVAAMETH